MKSLGGRFANWSEEYLHRVSKALVQEALVHGCTHIACEKLKHIRKRISNASKFQQWAFRRIQEYTEYKAAEYGIAVEKSAPHYTSQRCSHRSVPSRLYRSGATSLGRTGSTITIAWPKSTSE
jgi:IS605 OrfB family transposase